MYLSKDDVLRRLALREKDYTLPDGGAIRYRELNLRGRLDAQDAGKPDPETGVYQEYATFLATVTQRGVLKEAGGDLLFPPDMVPTLAEMMGDGSPMQLLAITIWRFSEADPDSFRGGGAAPGEAGNTDGNDGGADAGGES